MAEGEENPTYLTGRNTPLKLEEVLRILRNPDDSRTIREPPPSPRGGDIYLYKIDDFEHGVWKRDKYHFRADGKQKQPKVQPVVVKEFHKAYKEDKSTTRRFTKEAFYLYVKEPQCVLVHYRGDHELGLSDPKVSRRDKNKIIVQQTQNSQTLESTVNEDQQSQDTVSSIHQSNTSPPVSTCPEIEPMNVDVSEERPIVLSDSKSSTVAASKDPSPVTQHMLKRKHEDKRSPTMPNYVWENTANTGEDIEYLFTSCAKQQRLEPSPRAYRTCEILVGEAFPFQTLQVFTDKFLTHRDFIRSVQRIQAFSKHTEQNSDLQRSMNPYWSLNDEVGNLWNDDVVAVMRKLEWHLSPDLFDRRCDSSEYLKLIASIIVGAYHTQTDTGEFLKTLNERPQHLADAVEGESVSENCAYTVGRCTVMGKDLLGLTDNVWINDAILDCYLHLLELEWCSRIRGHCVVLPSYRYLQWNNGRYILSNNLRHNLIQCKWILLPVNEPVNVHWVLLVANVPDRTVGVVNSKPGIRVEDKILKHWRNFIGHTAVNTWTKKEYKMIEQADGHSCGVFAIMAAEAILAEEAPAIMRNYHSHWYRQYIQQRIQQCANIHNSDHFERTDMSYDGSTDDAGVGKNISEDKRMSNSENCARFDVMDSLNVDGMQPKESEDPVNGDQEQGQKHSCFHRLLSDKYTVACLLLIALSGGKLREDTLLEYVPNDLDADLEKRIRWSLQVSDITPEKNMKRTMRSKFLDLKKYCVMSSKGYFRYADESLIKYIKKFMHEEVEKLIKRMDLEFIYHYIKPNWIHSGGREKSFFEVEIGEDKTEFAINRFISAIGERRFAFVCCHSLCRSAVFIEKMVTTLLKKMTNHCIKEHFAKPDVEYGFSFMFWSSISDCTLFKDVVTERGVFSELCEPEAGFVSSLNHKHVNDDIFPITEIPLWNIRVSRAALKTILMVINIDIADIYLQEFHSYSLFDIACLIGSESLLETLSKQTSFQNGTDDNCVFYACVGKTTGHTAVIKMLLQKDVSIDITDSNGRTPLHVACISGNVQSVKLLIQRSLNNDVVVAHNNTASYVNGKMGLDQQLTRNVSRSRPCVEAKKHVEYDMSKLPNASLTRLSKNIDVKDKFSETPLHIAAQNGHREVAELLIQHKATVDEKEKDGWTPLHIAAQNGHREVAELLIQHKATVDEKNKNGWTPLHIAAQNGHREVAELLIQHKATVDEKEKDGWTPLHIAAQNGHREVAELLIQHKATVDEKVKDGGTPLHIAAQNGHREVAELLIQHKATVDEKEKDGGTPLHIAAQNGHREVAELLIQHKATVDEKEKDGGTPLHIAAQNGHREVAELLIQHKATVDEKVKDGWTPLHIAAQNGHREVAELLIQHKATVDEKEKDGGTPLHIAAQNGHREVAELLIQHKATVDEKEKDGWTPLHIAAQNGHREVAELLIQHKATVDEKNKNGWTPLHIAAQNGHREVAELLIQHKATVDEKNKDGRTPLHIAAQNGHREVAKLLIQHKATFDDATPLYMAALDLPTHRSKLLRSHFEHSYNQLDEDNLISAVDESTTFGNQRMCENSENNGSSFHTSLSRLQHFPQSLTHDYSEENRILGQGTPTYTSYLPGGYMSNDNTSNLNSASTVPSMQLNTHRGQLPPFFQERGNVSKSFQSFVQPFPIQATNQPLYREQSSRPTSVMLDTPLRPEYPASNSTQTSVRTYTQLRSSMAVTENLVSPPIQQKMNSQSHGDYQIPNSVMDLSSSTGTQTTIPKDISVFNDSGDPFYSLI